MQNSLNMSKIVWICQNLLQLPHWNREYDTQYVRGQVPKVFCGANNQSSLYAVLYLRITYRILVMIVCCAFIHSRIPGFWDLGIVYLCFQFLGIPFEFLIYYGAKFRNRWFLGLWLVLFCFKLITYILYFVKPFKSWKVSWKKKM